MSIPSLQGDAVRPDAVASSKAGTQRLFIALIPDASTQEALDPHLRIWGVTPESDPHGLSPLHLTLHFLGDVPVERIPVIRDVLAEIPMSGIQLVLRAPERWETAQLHPDENEALQDLRRRITHALLSLDLHVENRWTPHVTLLRDIAGRVMPTEIPDPVAWFACQFDLIRSHAVPQPSAPPHDPDRPHPPYRPRYEVLARYPVASTIRG